MGKAFLHRRAIQFAIRLRPGAPHGWTLALVQHPELDAGAVNDPAHYPVKRIDLPDKVTLAKTADGRIAGHFTDGFGFVRRQQGPRAKTHCRGRSLAPGVTAAHHDNIPM